MGGEQVWFSRPRVHEPRDGRGSHVCSSSKGRNQRMDWERLKVNLESYNQGHLLKWLDEMTETDQRTLYDQLKDVDVVKLHKCFTEAQRALSESSEKKDDRLEPLDQSIVASSSDKDKDQWYDIGLQLISNGKVGVLLLAGGQGTRLGVPYPKGMYNVKLPSNKTLYQLQAERILKLQKLAQEKYGNTEAAITWYIMTSEYTRDTTVKFFEEHNYFGLEKRNIFIFEQNTLPCVDFNGRILLDQKHSIARAPDGNGGLYTALINPNNNVIKDMKSRGVECVHVYGVDNILVKMADPVFTGYCWNRNSDCGAKVVRKSNPHEKVGAVCLLDGKYQVVEYSEITSATAEKRNPDGSLAFSAGNICNHYFTVPFLERICSDHKDDLTHHVAKKKIPFIDESGKKVVPTSPNGIKMEKFVFDVFQFSENFSVLEVLRDEEFAPLKNGIDSLTDSPVTVRQALMNLHLKYITRAGGIVTDENNTIIQPQVNGTNGVVCEISPLVSYSGEGLQELCHGTRFKLPLHLAD